MTGSYLKIGHRKVKRELTFFDPERIIGLDSSEKLGLRLERQRMKSMDPQDLVSFEILDGGGPYSHQ